jgi:hypothetical protein
VAASVVGVGLAGPAPVDAGAATPALPAILHVVRIGNDGTFDRVVFEFTGDTVPTATLDGPHANSGTLTSPTRIVVDVPHAAASPAQPAPQTPSLTG